MRMASLAFFCRAATFPCRTTIDGHAQPLRLRGQSQETIARDQHDCAQMAARAKDRLPVATDPIILAAANAVLGAAAGAVT